MIYFFFFNDTATTEIYTLSLHDALPIWGHHHHWQGGVYFRQPVHRYRKYVRKRHHRWVHRGGVVIKIIVLPGQDRKSTRLNSSHANISYAVFCLKKKKILIYSYTFIVCT